MADERDFAGEADSSCFLSLRGDGWDFFFIPPVFN